MIDSCLKDSTFTAVKGMQISKLGMSNRYHLSIENKMTFQGRAQKFHTDDVSLPRSWYSASDCLRQISLTIGSVRITTQTWVVTHHQYGISPLIPQTSLCGETSSGVLKCWLFS